MTILHDATSFIYSRTPTIAPAPSVCLLRERMLDKICCSLWAHMDWRRLGPSLNCSSKRRRRLKCHRQDLRGSEGNTQKASWQRQQIIMLMAVILKSAVLIPIFWQQNYCSRWRRTWDIGSLILAAAIFKNVGCECRRRSKVIYLKWWFPKTYIRYQNYWFTWSSY